MLFPDLGADEVLARVNAHWDTSGPLPVPKGEWLACPVCRAGQPQPRHWKFHDGRTTVRFRCDVSFKCTACSAVWEHGVALDHAAFHRGLPYQKNKHLIGWRQARDILEGSA